MPPERVKKPTRERLAGFDQNGIKADPRMVANTQPKPTMTSNRLSRLHVSIYHGVVKLDTQC